ncbi:hypothetical protein LguiA_028069 [Lonicera macranthoides]
MDQEDSKILLGSPLIVDEGIGIRGELRKDSFDITETNDELKRQVMIAGPLVLVSFFQYSLQMISVMFVGHLGELALSSASMATSFAGVTGFSIMATGNGRCTRNIMRTSLWSKTISYARHTQAESHASFHAYVHPHIVLVVPQVPNLHSLWPRPQNFYTRGYICMLAYTKHFPLRPTPVPAQILTESNFCLLVKRHGLVSLKNSCQQSLGVPFFRYPFSSNELNQFGRLVIRIFGSDVGVTSESQVRNINDVNQVAFLENLILTIFLQPQYKFSGLQNSLWFWQCTGSTGRDVPGCYTRADSSHNFVTVRNVWGYMYTNEGEVVRYLASIMPVLALSNFMDGMQGALSGLVDRNYRSPILLLVVTVRTDWEQQANFEILAFKIKLKYF